MEMQLYVLHVVPFVVIVYFAFLLFLRPPGSKHRLHSRAG